MGLDMYLYEKEYVSKYRDEDKWIALSEASGRDYDVEDYNSGVRYVTHEVGYWRKANAIHRWFVNNVQNGMDDCNEYHVSRDSLKELRSLCEEVIDNPSLAMELLPPSYGFFFGSQDIDSWYLDDLESTVDIIDKALDNAGRYPDFIYRASW